MSTHTKAVILLALTLCMLITHNPVSGRILKKCDADKELRKSKVVDKSFIAHLVCVMQYDGQFNTSLVKGPGSKASYSYGVFQISSDKWCSRYRPGGTCNKKCDDFANDDIQDDIICADLIFRNEGLKHWPGWVKYCKDGKNLPNLSDCKNSKRSGESESVDDLMDDIMEELEELEDDLAEVKRKIRKISEGELNPELIEYLRKDSQPLVNSAVEMEIGNDELEPIIPEELQ